MVSIKEFRKKWYKKEVILKLDGKSLNETINFICDNHLNDSLNWPKAKYKEIIQKRKTPVYLCSGGITSKTRRRAVIFTEQDLQDLFINNKNMQAFKNLDKILNKLN